MAPMGNAAAFPEHLAEGNSTAQVHWCTARSPDVSLRGAKRRGNLAGPGWITGQLRRIRKLVREIATGAKRPRNDNSGVHPILTMACTDRQHCAGPGCPLPYNARVAALKKQAQGSTSLRHYFSACFTASAAPAEPAAGRAGLLPDPSRPRRPAPSGRGRSRRGSEFPVRACRTPCGLRHRTEDDARPRS